MLPFQAHANYGTWSIDFVNEIYIHLQGEKIYFYNFLVLFLDHSGFPTYWSYTLNIHGDVIDPFNHNFYYSLGNMYRRPQYRPEWRILK